ncbi:MAG TPA: anion transporter [Polyangiaceae bacterium]|nr:anion transporter [Polyangiaceae bacterium]
MRLLSAGGLMYAACAVFAVVYFGLAVGRLPFLRLDRAGIALVGATAMLVLDVVGFDEAVAVIDYRTLALLFGMMLVVAYLRVGGFFRTLAAWLLDHARSPHGVLVTVIAFAGVLSTILVNDVVCLALGPIVIRLARRIRRDPVPYLVGLATAANIGSVATITGNPQNMIVGSFSGISYSAFAARLAPIAAVGLIIDYAVIALAFRGVLGREVDPPPGSENLREPFGDAETELLPKGVAVLAASVALFFVGAPTALVALGAAALIMLGRVVPAKLYAQVDWSLLVMFAALFVVVHGFESHFVARFDLARVAAAQRAPDLEIAATSAALSNLVSNVPAVLLLKSGVSALAPAARANAWLSVAMSSTLSGNLTPIASIANLIVIEGARREGVEVRFGAYCKVGIPVTLISLGTGVLWLAHMR